MFENVRDATRHRTESLSRSVARNRPSAVLTRGGRGMQHVRHSALVVGVNVFGAGMW